MLSIIARFTILLSAFLLPALGQAQVILEFNSTEPQFITPCGPPADFTLLIKNEGNQALVGASLSLDLPEGISYTPGSVSSATEANISDLNNPIFSLDDLTPNSLVQVAVQATIDCDLLNTSDPIINAWEVSGAAGVFTYQSSPYNVNLPSLVTSNLQNFDYQGQVGDVFIRSFQLTNSGFGPVSNLTIEDVFPASVDILNGGPGNFQVFGNTATITLSGADFMLIGDGDDLLEQGESITITETIEILDCLPGDSPITIGWGCNGLICDNIDLEAEVTVLTQLPELDWSFGNVSYAGFCDPGFVTVNIVNNGGGSANTSNAFNLILEPGMATPGNQVPPDHTGCLQLTNFTINGQVLSDDTINYAGYGLDLSQLVNDPDGPGGLSDLDNDGQFDDLAFGESFQLVAEVVVDPVCLGTGCVEDIPPSVFKLRHYFENQCQLASDAQLVDDSYLYELPGTSVTDNLEPEYGDAEAFNLSLLLSRDFIGYDCPNGQLELTVELPPVLELQLGATVLLNGSPVAISQIGNTISFQTDLAAQYSVILPVVTLCDSTFVELANFPCAVVSTTPSVYQVNVTSTFFCDPGCSQPVDLFCGSSNSFIVRCENDLPIPPEGISAYEFEVERLSLGWTDASLSTKVDPLTPGLAKDHAMVFDTVRYSISANVFGAGDYTDSRFYLFYFNDLEDPYFSYLTGNLRFYDQETDSYLDCPNFTPDEVIASEGAHSQTFDLAPLFLPGGCLDGLTITAGDSLFVEMDVVMEDNLPGSLVPVGGLNAGFLFEFSGEYISCNEVPGILQVIDPGFVFQAYLESTAMACDTLLFEGRFLQGKPSVGPNDPFPFEWRPYSRIDSISFEIPGDLEYVPGSSLLMYELRPDQSVNGPVVVQNVPIPEPQITLLPNDHWQLAYTQSNAFPTVDVIKGLTMNNLQFKAFPTCMPESNVSFSADLDFTEYLYSVDEQVQSNRDVSFTGDYLLGLRSFTVIDPSVDGQSDVATWTMELCNSTLGSFSPLSIPNNFLVLDLPTNGVVPIAFTNVSDPNNPITLPIVPFGPDGDMIVYIGDLPPDFCGLYELSTTFTSCDPIEIPIYFDFACSGYPQDSMELVNTCSQQAFTETLSIIPQDAALQVNMVTTPNNPVDLCTPLTYELLVINTLPGRAYDIDVVIELPANGLVIVPGSCSFEYGNSGFTPIADPVLIPGTDQYVWEMDLLSNPLAVQGLGGVGQAIPTEFRIRFDVETDCSFENLSLLSYFSDWENSCTSTDTTAVFFTPPIEVEGIPLNFNTYVPDFSGPPLQNCVAQIDYTVSLTNQGPEETTSTEVVRVILDPALDYVPNTFQELFNFPGGGEPLNYLFNGQRYLEWNLPDGIAAGQILEFSFGLTTVEPDSLACSQTPVEVVVADVINIPCASAPGGNCLLEFGQSDASFTLDLEAAEYSLDFLSATSEPLDANSELYTMSYLLTNVGGLTGAGQLEVDFYLDTNGNGTFDMGTDLFVAQNLVDGGLLAPGQDTSLLQSFAVDGANTCSDILVVLNAAGNPCICASAEAIFPALPLENAGSADTLCFGQSFLIGGPAQAGYSYEWLPGTYVVDPNSSATEYAYTGPVPPGNILVDTLILHTIRTQGCETFDTLVVTTNFLEAMIAVASDYNGFGVSCPQASDGSLEGSLVGGEAPFSWIWAGGLPDDPVQNNLPAGMYQLTVSDGLGCEATATADLTEPPGLGNDFLLSDYNGFSVSCSGGADGTLQSVPNGGVGGYSWLWSTLEDSDLLTDLMAGDYEVTITDDNGCTLLDTVNLTEPTVLTLDLLSTPILCADGTNGTITITAGGGVGPYDFAGTGFDPELLVTGLDQAGMVSVVITDANGCASEDSVLVDQLISTFSLTSDPVICPGGNEGTICVVPEDAFPPYSYNWEDSSADSCRIDLSAGTYLVTVTDGNGCTYIYEENLDDIPGFDLDYEVEDVSCFGGSDGSILVAALGGTAPYSFSWTGGLQGPVLSGLTAGPYGLTLTDAAGCTFEDQATVGTPPEITLSFAAVDVTCNAGDDGSITAVTGGGTPPYTLNWNNGQSGSLVTGLVAGLYEVTLTDGAGCLAFGVQEIAQPAYPPALFEDIDITCYGFDDGQIQVEDPLGSAYSYSIDGSTFQSDSVFNNLSPGSYTLYIEDPLGCIYTYPAFIQEPPEELIFVSPDTSIYLGETVQISAYSLTTIASYAWTPGLTLECPDCPVTVAAPITTTTYLVTAISDQGCVDEEEVTVRILIDEDVYIPNIFSPDLNGTNDEFLIFSGPSVQSVAYLRIFDRWGGQVFERTDFPTNVPSLGWDGTVRGEPANQGVYVYVAEVVYIDGRRELFKGDVTLVR